MNLAKEMGNIYNYGHNDINHLLDETIKDVGLKIKLFKHITPIFNSKSYADNFRLAIEGNQYLMNAYKRQAAKGCCGFLDQCVVIDGIKFYYGCNFGH